jgi:hypothetical protein
MGEGYNNCIMLLLVEEGDTISKMSVFAVWHWQQFLPKNLNYKVR